MEHRGNGRFKVQYAGSGFILKACNENASDAFGCGLKVYVLCCGTCFNMDVAKPASAIGAGANAVLVGAGAAVAAAEFAVPAVASVVIAGAAAELHAAVVAAGALVTAGANCLTF